MPLDLEHLPPGDGEREDSGEDVYARLAKSRERLVAQSTRWFPMPLAGLLVRYRRVDLERYRETWTIEAEWERWAQMLIDACDGFAAVDSSIELDDAGQPKIEPPLLLDDFDQPVKFDTLALKIGVDVDPVRGARGLVLDVFGGSDMQTSLADHAQRVDAWMSTAASDDRERLAKG